MMTRTRDKTLTFGKPFLLKGVDRVLPAGDYRVATDEELIEGLSFPVYRRVATMIFDEVDQGVGGVAVVIQQGGDQPVAVAHAAAVAPAHRHVSLDDPYCQAIQTG